MLSRTNLVLSACLVMVVVATVLMQVDHSKPNLEFMPDMKYSPAKTAFATSARLPDGRTLQPPPHGTVARGQMPLHFAATPEDAVRAGVELRNPYRVAANDGVENDATPQPEKPQDGEPTAQGAEPDGKTDATPDASTDASTDDAVQDDGPAVGNNASGGRPADGVVDPAAAEAAALAQRWQASVDRGSEIYSTFCVSCHGPRGAGDGPVARRGFPPPPSLLTGKSVAMKDGQLFHILTYGQGSMAPMAAQLDRDQRWAVINFLREMQKASPPAETTEPQDSPEPASNPPGK